MNSHGTRIDAQETTNIVANTPKGQRTEAAFVQAARICFAELGYLNTKISDIATAAGRSTASFYNYYDSKEQLLEALLKEFTTGVVEAALATRHNDPQAGVRAAVTAYWNMFREYRPEMIGLIQMSMLDETFRQRWLDNRIAGIKQVLLSFDRAEQAGYAIGLPHDALASALVSAMEHTCYVWQSVGGDLGVNRPDDESAIDVLAALWYRTVYQQPTD